MARTKCPNCGSIKLQKKGTRAGKQRYKCNKCGANFTQGVEYVKQIKREPVQLRCPQCDSNHIRRDGISARGLQRYECYDCHTNFDEISIKKKKRITWKCPYCGGDLSYSGFGRKKQREYKCKVCDRSCSADASGKPIATYKFREVNKEIQCPDCGTYDISKSGSSKGRKRYKCNECGRVFSYGDNVKRVHKTNSQQEAMEKILKGKSRKKVAEEYGYTVDYLNKLVKTDEYKESLTQEQINTIIRFGVFCNVPVDYLAEYIPCSEIKCLEVIREYKAKHCSVD